MRNQDDLALMWEAATLYYEKKYTQQEIAGLMDLSRQTVSKLLNDAVKENIVQITIRDPQKDCRDLEDALCRTFGISGAVVCAVSKKNPTLCKLMTVKAAVGYLLPLLKEGNQKIAVSWGRTINDLINQLPEIQTTGNLVFPLFGATDVEDICFSSNEIARSLADKTGSDAQFAWFPYLTESSQDHILLKKTGYYKKIEPLWRQIDLALVGIGNTDIVTMFGDIIGCPPDASNITGDIATHFFDRNGDFTTRGQNTLCASVQNLKDAKNVVAIAGGSDKSGAIIGALKTGLVDVLVTDEHTARQVLGECRNQ